MFLRYNRITATLQLKFMVRVISNVECFLLLDHTIITIIMKHLFTNCLFDLLRVFRNRLNTRRIPEYSLLKTQQMPLPSNTAVYL